MVRRDQLRANILLGFEHPLIRVDELFALLQVLRPQPVQLALHISQLALPVMLVAEEEADKGDEKEELDAGGDDEKSHRRHALAWVLQGGCHTIAPIGE